MAITSKDISARLRVTDSSLKTICSYSGLDPQSQPTGIGLFGEAIGILRGEEIGFQYLTVETQLEEAE